jgi:hypothetical protein
VRLGYRIGLVGDQALDLFGEIFNLTDRNNFANPTGDRASANFLRLTGLDTSSTPRTAQFGVRFVF